MSLHNLFDRCNDGLCCYFGRLSLRGHFLFLACSFCQLCDVQLDFLLPLLSCNLSNLTTYDMRHYGGRATIASKITSSVALNGSFTHVQVGSFCALIYRLCISALKSAALCKWLYTVEDNHDLRLICVQILASMNIQNTLISRILVASFVARRELYRTTSGRFLSMLGDWLPFGISPVTSRILMRNMHNGKSYRAPGLPTIHQKFVTEKLRPVELNPLCALLHERNDKGWHLVCTAFPPNFTGQ